MLNENSKNMQFSDPELQMKWDAVEAMSSNPDIVAKWRENDRERRSAWWKTWFYVVLFFVAITASFLYRVYHTEPTSEVVIYNIPLLLLPFGVILTTFPRRKK